VPLLTTSARANYFVLGALQFGHLIDEEGIRALQYLQETISFDTDWFLFVMPD
jgi:hypothetical protein